MTDLPENVQSLIDYKLAKSTRVHPIQLGENHRVWIKREDELSASISGSKLRKFASLIPYFKKERVEYVVAIGGPHSNNLVGLVQLLKENEIEFHLLVRAPADRSLRGNALLLAMLSMPESCHQIDRCDWGHVHERADEIIRNRKTKEKTMIIPEGCSVIQSLAGAMSLAEDILKNEVEQGCQFQRIYIDSGTGLSAVGLILGLELLLDEEVCSEKELIITLIAGDEDFFGERLAFFRKEFFLSSNIKIKKRLAYKVIRPVLAPKFGATNASLLKACNNIAQSHGLLMDPVYSVKHFETMKHHARNAEQAESLFIFNGSPLGLMGFQEKLELIR